MKHVVCLGGGTGQSQVLRGLRGRGLHITSIVGVTDNGGHSGVLREIFGIPQVGDIRNCLVSLGDDRRLLTKLLKYRFREGALDGVSLGNLIVVALIRHCGSLSRAIAALEKELGVGATMIPVSDHSTNICALLADGRTIRGEWQIIMRQPRTPITGLFHEPPVDCHPDCVRALERADMIVFCPGSLLTGTVSCLLTRGIREAIARSRALKVQICNIMTHPGQTDRFTARDHLVTLTQYLGVPPDVFVVNTGKPPSFLLRPYRAQGAEPVRDDTEGLKTPRVIRADLVERSGREVLQLYDRGGSGKLASLPHFIRHDPERIGNLLVDLLARYRPATCRRASSR